MSDSSIKRNKKQQKDPIPESALRGFKYFKELSPILERLHSENNHHRELHFNQYIAMLLFYFFNPVVTSLRAIQQVSGLKSLDRGRLFGRGAEGYRCASRQSAMPGRSIRQCQNS